MSTMAKALPLLEHLDTRRPEIGLVDIFKFAKFNKATRRWLLMALAAIREAPFPLIELARPVVEALAQRARETMPISEAADEALSSVFVCEFAAA